MNNLNQGIIELIHNYNVTRTLFINDKDNKLFINYYVNHIYIINLETDNLRRNYIIRLMEKYKINFELIIVPRLDKSQYDIIGNNKIKIGEAGCYLSHMYCLNDAITHNYDNIIIFEDDIILHKNFHNIFNKNITENNFDIFMLGASDFYFRHTNSKLLDVEKSVYKPDLSTRFLCGTYAIFYSKNGYSKMFNVRLKYPTYMDNNLIQFLDNFHNTFYVSHPSLVAADVSNTNIDHDFWIINPFRDKYYYNNCYNNRFIFSEYNFINLIILNNCIIDTKLSYKDNILNTLNFFFKNDLDKINTIKNRFEYDFFTNDDLKYITNKNDLLI